MVKRARGRLMLSLDRGEAAAPLVTQIYRALRSGILEGRINGDERLPSSRVLANELDVSRTTAEEAYSKLVSEGYVVRRAGAGTYVAKLDVVQRRTTKKRAHCPPAPRPLSSRASALHGHVCFPDANTPRAFLAGTPDVREFPIQTWRGLITRSLRHATPATLGAGDPAGFMPLREAIASYLNGARGVNCSADKVLIFNSSQQAIDLCARLLLDEGDDVWMEEPGYPGARAAFEMSGCRIVPVAVDAQGLRVDAGIASAPHAKAAYVTPSHQFPMGVALSLERRLALLNWAKTSGAWIIEDDYDSEFRYERPALASIQGLDDDERVLYVGTFTKVLFPALRLAYVVAPEDLIEPLILARGLTDGHPPLSTQIALADFISSGHFTAHIRRMRAIYAERRDALTAALARELPGILAPGNAEAGLHTVAFCKEDDTRLSRRLGESGVPAHALSRYFHKAPSANGLFLGYAALRPAEIVSAVKTMSHVMSGAKPSL